MIRVRATKDGMYAGYYYEGPIESEQGTKPGDIFDIDERPYEVKDEHGKPVYEQVMVNGRPKMDKGEPVMQPKMATFFSHEWMERVADDTDLTYPDREPWKIPEPYRVKKAKQGKVIALPEEVAALAESPI